MLRRASDGGLPEASKQIAWMYGAGHGVEKSETESFRWTLKAAGQNALAKYHLGCLYEDGKGVPRSVEKAKELYADSAEWGNEDARRSILRLDRLEGRGSTTTDDDPA